MKKVVIESPYAGDVRVNRVYARSCMRDSLQKGEAPIASHLLYTQEGVLDDNDPKERQRGIDAGFLWGATATLIAFYCDNGWSKGMEAALRYWTGEGILCEIRYLDKEEK